jgi:Flp pilus assembly protein TadG
MSTAPEHADVLETINRSVERLQKSARTTIPMFLIGILATLVAAAVAVYYIVTLSADLRDARQKLGQSQAALNETQDRLTSLGEALRASQQHATSPAAAQSLANAISDVSSSQQSLTAVSSSINAAAAKIAPTVNSQAPLGTCRLRVGSVAYIDGDCEIALSRGGSFTIWTVGRTGPSASLVRSGASATGTWQSAPGAAPADLGTLQRKGACWFNQNAEICAWK